MISQHPYESMFENWGCCNKNPVVPVVTVKMEICHCNLWLKSLSSQLAQISVCPSLNLPSKVKDVSYKGVHKLWQYSKTCLWCWLDFGLSGSTLVDFMFGDSLEKLFLYSYCILYRTSTWNYNIKFWNMNTTYVQTHFCPFLTLTWLLKYLGPPKENQHLIAPSLDMMNKRFRLLLLYTESKQL